MDNYRVDKIPLRKLKKFAESALIDKKTYPFLPISPERALAQANNPAASPEDIVFLVAYHNDKCVGYRGWLPCWVEVEGKIHKIFAVSTFYVLPEYRRKKIFENQTIARYFHTLFFALSSDGLATGSSVYARRFYSKDKRFIPIPSLTYLRIRTGYIFLFSSMFKKLCRIKSLRIVRPLFLKLTTICAQTIDRLNYSLLSPLLTSSIVNKYLEIEIIKINKVSELYSDSLVPYANKDITSFRNAKIVNWMIHYPWVLDDHQHKEDYYFATPRERFEFLSYHLTLKEKNFPIGYVVFSISTQDGYTTLKILDYKISKEKYLSYILKLALDISAAENANVIECSNEFWSETGSLKLLRSITGQHERAYFLWSNKDGIFGQHSFKFNSSYSDGDKPFT